MTHKAFDRLFSKSMITENGCWEYSGSLNTGGYGQAWCEGRIVLAHRLSWIYHNGDIPEGMFVLHTCDNRRCTNPKHLFLGTHQDNSDDKIAKGRDYHPKGQENGFARLNNAEVIEIRELLRQGIGTSEIGRLYNVSPCTISDIKFYRSWKDV